MPVEVKLCRDFGFNCGAIAVISVEEFCECKCVIAFSSVEICVSVLRLIQRNFGGGGIQMLSGE